MEARQAKAIAPRFPPMFLLGTLKLTAFLLCGATASATCNAVHFPAGASSAEISGSVPADDRLNPAEPLCYSLNVCAGQRIRISLLSGGNVAISIPGQGDARDSFDFVTQRGTYELHVFPLFPGREAEPFRIHVEVVDQSP